MLKPQSGRAVTNEPLMSNNERLITQTSEGFLQGLPEIYECETHPYKTLCTKTDSEAATHPWLFAADGHYVRAFIAGGPPGSELDPNIAIGYGTCISFSARSKPAGELYPKPILSQRRNHV
jgi:hypothetical protein